MRMTTVGLVLVTASALVVPGSAFASGHGQQHQTRCNNDGHKYIFGISAKAHGKRAKFVGKFERFHPCGEDDGYFTGFKTKKTITLTLTPKSTIKVFKHELDPSATKKVTAAQFPHEFKTHKDETIYRFSGPRSNVKKLSEHFVS
jgi:hypothetical protein